MDLLWPESSFIQATFHLTITHPDKLCIAVLKASKKEVVYDYLILVLKEPFHDAGTKHTKKRRKWNENHPFIT